VILLVTNRDDLTADWLIVELQRRRARYVRFNTEDFPQRSSIRWRVDAASLTLGKAEVHAKEIEAVWYRRPVVPRPRSGLTADEGTWVIRESSAVLDGFWRTLETRWVSRPEAIRLADSKPQQLADASKLGFEIPDTEITNNTDHVKARGTTWWVQNDPLDLDANLYHGRPVPGDLRVVRENRGELAILDRSADDAAQCFLQGVEPATELVRVVRL
jgi:hypothetical protein